MSSVSGFWFKYNKVVCFLLIYRKLIDLAPVRVGNSSFKVFSITFAFLCEKKMLVLSANRMKSNTFDTSHISLINVN